MTAAAPADLGPALRRVLDALESLGRTPRRDASGWMAKCPAHDDRRPSLHVAQGREGALVKCYAGCTADAIVSALSLDTPDLFDRPRSDNGAAEPASRIVATYTYQDEHGEPLFEVVRMEPKTFRQRMPDGTWGIRGVRRVLYRLPEVLAAVAADDRVYVVEGEKDADLAAAADLVATTCPGGAGKWRAEYAEALRGADATRRGAGTRATWPPRSTASPAASRSWSPLRGRTSPTTWRRGIARRISCP